jgi:beta-lactam-binding protein with PASTA domain
VVDAQYYATWKNSGCTGYSVAPLIEATEALEAAGLTYEVIDSTHYVPGVKEGAVVEVFPEAYAEVKLGRTLFISTNPSALPKYATT